MIELIGQPLSRNLDLFNPGDKARGVYQGVKTGEEVAPAPEVRSETLYYSEPKSGRDFRWLMIDVDNAGHVTCTHNWITD